MGIGKHKKLTRNSVFQVVSIWGKIGMVCEECGNEVNAVTFVNIYSISNASLSPAITVH